MWIMRKENPHLNDGLIIEAVTQAVSWLGKSQKALKPLCGSGSRCLWMQAREHCLLCLAGLCNPHSELMALSHSVPPAPVLVTENNDNGWQMTGSRREAPQSHPITPHYMHILKQGWGYLGKYIIHKEEGILPVREKGSKGRWGTNERKTRLCSDQPPWERYLLLEPSATTQEQGRATNLFSKPWKVQVPTDSLVAKSKQGRVFKTTKTLLQPSQLPSWRIGPPLQEFYVPSL